MADMFLRMRRFSQRELRRRWAHLRDVTLKSGRVTLERPIFIWGMGRSGTHLVFDLMSLHPSLTCLKAGARWKKGLWGDMHWGDDTPPRLRGKRIPYEGVQHFWTDADVRSSGTGLFTRGELTDRLIRTVRGRYASFHREWLWKRSPRFRILDKSPVYIMMLNVIDAVFPDAYHVFCLRDPRAVVNSILRLARFPEREGATAGIPETGFYGSMRPPGFEEYERRPLVERLSWQVTTIMRIGLSSRKFLGDRLYAFPYERLLTDAHGTAADLFRYAGLPAFPEIREMIPPAFPNYSPAWPRPDGLIAEPYGLRRCYRDDEVEQFALAEELAADLGYDKYQVGVLSRAEG